MTAKKTTTSRKATTSSKATPARTRKPTPSQADRKAMERKAKWDKAIRRAQAIAQGAMIVALAVIGFMGSFQHLRDLGIMAGGTDETWWGTANLAPISVDLMLIIASIQLRRKGISDVSRLIARLCSLAGLALSIAGNVLVAWLHLPMGADSLRVTYTLIWAAVPVLSLLGAVEMLTHTRKDRPTVSRVTKAHKASEVSIPVPPIRTRTASWADTALARLLGAHRPA